jgi:hypothetical protein
MKITLLAQFPGAKQNAFFLNELHVVVHSAVTSLSTLNQIIAIFTISMKLIDVLVLSLAVAFLIIGIHQTMTLGFGKAYWAIMLSLILYFVYILRKKK